MPDVAAPLLADGFYDVPPGKVAVIVTHLEMRHPQVRKTPLPAGLTFDNLARDLDTYRDIFRRVGADWLWYGRLKKSDAELTEILSDSDTHLYTLRQNGTPQAILELDFRQSGACELAYFGVTPDLIGTGAGAYLIDRAIELAFAANITRFHLHTCTIDSPQALPFYLRAGFTPVRQQIEIADDPRLIDLHDPARGPHVPIFDP